MFYKVVNNKTTLGYSVMGILILLEKLHIEKINTIVQPLPINVLVSRVAFEKPSI